MKNIKAILEGYEGITDDQRKAIVEAVNENYRSIEEVTKKNERISELEEQNASLREQVGKLEGTGEEIEKLREQVSDFERAETERKQREEEATKRASFRELFEASIGDREFANDLMRDTVFERAYERCQAQQGMGIKDAVDAVTKDVDGVWKNPQQNVHKMPEQGLITGTSDSQSATKKSLADKLFGGN